MHFFLDSADIREIEYFSNLGMIDGVTTNPSLMSKTHGEFRETIASICKIVQGDVSVEVTATDFAGMIEQGSRILDIASNVVLKLPITVEGYRACKYFSNQSKKVNMTLCFSPIQALFAAKSGAAYVSPFVGRLEDIGEDGVQLIAKIRSIYNNYKMPTKILAASIRNVQHVEQVALCGADVVTCSDKLMHGILNHPLTDKGLEIFAKDWSNSHLTI